MANKDHLKAVSDGPTLWNQRRILLSGKIDLREADLTRKYLNNTDLQYVDLSGALLHEAYLRGANLHAADLIGANLSGADLGEANLCGANLNYANLNRANLKGANLNNADLEGATLIGAVLADANFTQANLAYADFFRARLDRTVFGDVDLRNVNHLESVLHSGPSIIGIETLFRSDGKIPEVFLRDAGIPEDFITFVPSLVGRAIEFYSCFISFSHKDEEFSRRLHSRMRAANLRVWYAPEDMKGGRKLHEEIFTAIQLHDKLLLVLTENSMNSEWVVSEIRRAKKVEREECRRKLFPIRLVDFDAIQKWNCFDADSGKDLAVELREYYIPDFSGWKDHDAFEREFEKLYRDLKATER